MFATVIESPLLARSYGACSREQLLHSTLQHFETVDALQARDPAARCCHAQHMRAAARSFRDDERHGGTAPKRRNKRPAATDNVSLPTRDETLPRLAPTCEVACMERIPDRLLHVRDAHMLERMSDAAFADSDLITTTRWARPDLWFIERHGDSLRGCVGVVWREIVADGTPVRVGGVASLVVVPQARGSGLGARLLDRALAEMRALPAIAAGMLLCEDELVPFYARLGWRRVAASVRCMQPGGEIDWAGAAMCHTLVMSALDSARFVRLNGLPW